MLCFALYSASMAAQQAYKPLLDPLGLTYPQYLVLSVLWQGDGLTMGALGRMVQLDSNTLTPLVKRLEARGFVARRRDPQDERQVRVTLTEAGQDLRQQAEPVAACFLSRSGLDVDQAVALRDAVIALRDHLRDAGREGGGTTPGVGNT